MRKHEKVKLDKLRKHLKLKDIHQVRKHINQTRKCLGRNWIVTIKVAGGMKIVKITCISNRLRYYIFQ